MTGSTLIGVACGYTLLNSIVKKEIEQDTVPAVKSRIPKIFVLLILGSSILYISLNGFLHPIKLVDVQADIVKNDNQTGYLANDGKDPVYFIRTEINYRLKFENMPIRSIRQPGKELKIKVEPQEELRSLFSEDIFKQPDGIGFTGSGKETEITLTYTIGSIDPEGNNVDIPPPSPEILEQITLNDTRAVTINVPAESIWPWLVQMGIIGMRQSRRSAPDCACKPVSCILQDGAIFAGCCRRSFGERGTVAFLDPHSGSGQNAEIYPGRGPGFRACQRNGA